MRSSLLPLSVAAVLALSACGGDAPATGTPRQAAPSSAATLPAAEDVPGGADGSTAAEAPAGAPAATPGTLEVPSPVVGPSTAAGATPRAGGADAVPGSSAAPAAAAPPARASARAAAPRGTVPGRYDYETSGTFTTTAGGAAGVPASRSGSGSAVLTVDRPAGGRQLLVLDGGQGRTETDVELRPDGRHLVRLLLTTPGFSEEFQPERPVLLLPSPLVTGQSWTWTARSTDGTTTVTARSRVTGDRTQTVGGTRVATAVVETVLSIRGDVVYDGTTTVDHEPQRGLPVREASSGQGTVRGVSFTSRTTTALRSLDPR